MSRSVSRKPPSSSSLTTKHLTDGEWVKSGDYTHHICCDCALTHAVKYKLIDGALWEQWTRDEKETRLERRKSKAGK
jgi:hypothetical protein